eukprot:257268-Pelagomonas_calceolata.AAC.5
MAKPFPAGGRSRYHFSRKAAANIVDDMIEALWLPARKCCGKGEGHTEASHCFRLERDISVDRKCSWQSQLLFF